MNRARKGAGAKAALPDVLVVGRGKVGRALARGLRDAGRLVALVAGRSHPERWPVAPIVWLAVPDGSIGEVAASLARASAPPRRVVLHAAGALGPDALGALRPLGVAVAQAHPLLSFASPRHPPPLAGGALVTRGDGRATAVAAGLARSLGMRRVRGPNEPSLYHAGAALAANGAAALASAACRLLEASGLSRADARRALGPLLASVAQNVARLGLPEALTGPVRRGDAATVARHLAAVAAHAPDALPLVRGSILAQLPLARALGEAAEADLASIERSAAREARPSKNLRG